MHPDDIEPIARAIGALVAGSPGLYRWNDYTADEDLIPLKQTADDNIHFVRATEPKARMELFGISGADLVDIVIHPLVVLKSSRKATASLELDNRYGLTPAEAEIYLEFANGQTELDAVKAGFEVASKSTFGTGATSPVKGEQELSLTITSEWSKQSGTTKDTKVGGRFPVKALPYTRISYWLEWDEQDVRRHISGFGTFNCGVRIGKRAKKSGDGRWRWQGDHTWHSLADLIATAEGRGSVHFPLRDYWREHPPASELIVPVKAQPRRSYDQYDEFKANNRLKVMIDTLDDLRPDNDEEED